MGFVTFISNRVQLENEVAEAKARALEIIGGKAETYAKQLSMIL